MKILVAEDDPSARLLLTGTLTKVGHEVVIAEDGLLAWDRLQDADAPRLLLLDWMMPGLDGPELCRRVRERPHDDPTYIILVTARSSPAEIACGLDAGADDYIVKPYHAVELTSRVRAGERQLQLQTTLKRRVHELQETLLYVHQLEDLLSVCMYCKRVHDDGDNWKHFDEYLQAHTHSRISHGCCPNCFDTHYPRKD